MFFCHKELFKNISYKQENPTFVIDHLFSIKSNKNWIKIFIKIGRNRLTNSLHKIGCYKKLSKLSANLYIQMIRQNTHFLKIWANFVEKWPSCEKNWILRGFALKIPRSRTSPKLKKINSVSEAKWDIVTDMHFILEKNWKTYKNIQKGKFII